MTAVCTVVLQVCMELGRDVPDSSREAYLISYPGAFHFVNVKFEEISAIDEGEDPLLIKSPRRKAKAQEVSCFSVYVP
jgi:hypothetical protein